MAISLYDISVGSYVQILGGVSAVLAKGKAHASSNNIDLGELLSSQLAEDMAPLGFQLISVVHHSWGAISGIKAGVFNPPPKYAGQSYDELHTAIDDARNSLAAMSAVEINGLEGNDMLFQSGDFKLPFTAEGFIQSFSLPNFYFHATTTYAFLRMNGVPLGKGDFLGDMRLGS